jgi:hypothetical protein
VRSNDRGSAAALDVHCEATAEAVGCSRLGGADPSRSPPPGRLVAKRVRHRHRALALGKIRRCRCAPLCPGRE